MTNCYEISDNLWGKIEAYLPGRRGSVGREAKDNRNFINAVVWVLHSQAPWSHLPESYGKWKNVHRRYYRWRDLGIWEVIFEQIKDEPEFELLIGNLGD